LRSPQPTISADSSFLRELKRVLARLTAVADAESLVSLLTDYFHFFRATGNASAKDATTAKPELMPHLWFLAEKLLRFTEGSNDGETLTRSARVLGCLQLTVPVSGRRWRELQFGYKLMYRATLSLRLLDHALQHKLVADPVLQLYFDQRIAGNDDCPYRLNVQLPLVIAVMLMDAGQLSPDAVTLLTGYAGELDSARALAAEERAEYLQRCQKASQQLLHNALELLPYRGNSKQEKQQHVLLQQQRLNLIRQLIQLQTNPTSALGNVLKIPQVYSSMVLPGRQRYVYEALPKASLLLKDSVSRGLLNAMMVKHFLKITGIFPQGFGIVFTPSQQDGMAAERYEMAVVNQLYPANIAEPLCRIVSRNLQYRRGGHNCVVSVEHNLYFKPARDRLAVIPSQRLEDILARLSADWQPGQLRRFMPRCWHPEQFFSQAEHQNLWNNAPQQRN
jgi:hypothetical protein